jgi:hypothetical protein
MDAKPAFFERPAPAEQRIGADETMRKADSSTVTSATCWRLNRLARSRRRWYNVCCGHEATILYSVQGGF